MKRILALIALFVLAICSIPPVAAQLVPVWEYSVAAGNKPSWLAQGLQRGLAAGKVGGQDLLFVASREAGGMVRVLDPATGAVLDTLSNTGISGGTFVLNDVGVSDDGVVFGCNMTTAAHATPFKVYRWDGLCGLPHSSDDR